MDKINYRIARANDIDSIFDIIEKAIEKMHSQGINQWNEYYPTHNMVASDVENKQMYVGEIENKIAVIFVINKKYEEEYLGGEWEYTGDDYRVIHRLCVNPEMQHQGIGTKTLEYIENMLKIEGVKAIRLDAFLNNPHSVNLYKKMEYKTVGSIVLYEKRFYLMEKII